MLSSNIKNITPKDKKMEWFEVFVSLANMEVIFRLSLTTKGFYEKLRTSKSLIINELLKGKVTRTDEDLDNYLPFLLSLGTKEFLKIMGISFKELIMKCSSPLFEFRWIDFAKMASLSYVQLKGLPDYFYIRISEDIILDCFIRSFFSFDELNDLIKNIRILEIFELEMISRYSLMDRSKDLIWLVNSFRSIRV